MSADLLAEFDSFYKSPQDARPSATLGSNDLSFLSDTGGNAQSWQGSNPSQWQSPAARPNNDKWSGITATSVQRIDLPRDDIWSSFEAPADQIKVQTQGTSKHGYEGPFMEKGIQRTVNQDKPGVVRRPTLDLFSSNMDVFTGPTRPKPTIRTERLPLSRPAPTPVTKSSYGEVLFDAADELSPELEDDDEFGDFETGTPEPAPQSSPSLSLNSMFGAATLEPKTAKWQSDLLSTTTNYGGSLPYPQAPKSPSFQERKPFAELGVSTKQIFTTKTEDKPNVASPITAWPTYAPKVPKPAPSADSPTPDNALDDEWGDFADLPPETPAVESVKAASGIQADAWAWDAVDQVSDPTPAPAAVFTAPPTNIPPPSILLTLFPLLFDLPQSKLFKVIAHQPFSLKNRIISDPSTIDFLRAYLLIATVAARVTAGRKLRWKRDTLLSQSMKIGPAAADGRGGMKLAGIDKAEIAREDREAADIVRVWREQLGRLRSAVAVANSSIRDASAHLAIPDISESMYVKTQAGGLSAPKPCIICGLKREERVDKVDAQVEDSFGEFWTEHWGHRTCRNFWLEHESKLKHR